MSGAETDPNTGLRVVRLAKLSQEQKERYYDFLIAQNIQFAPDHDGNYSAVVRVVKPAGRSKTAGQSTMSKSMPAGGPRSMNTSQVSQGKQEAAKNQLSLDITQMLQRYLKFCSLITTLDTLTPRCRSITWVMKFMEEIFDARFKDSVKEVEDLMKGIVRENRIGGGSMPFADYAYEFLSKQFGLKGLRDQQALDLVYNVDQYRRDYLEVDLFARFLEHAFDNEDLLFFVYMRDKVRRDLKLPSVSATLAQNAPAKVSSLLEPVLLTPKTCVRLAKMIFGNSADLVDLLVSFTQMLDAYIAGKKTKERKLELNEFYNLAVLEYHHTRPGMERALEQRFARAENDDILAEADRQYRGESAPPRDEQEDDLVVPKELLERLWNVSEQYLSIVMRLSNDLPSDITNEIHQEVSAQLHAKVASLLNDIVNISLVDALKPEPVYEGQMDQHAAVCLRYRKDLRVQLEALVRNDNKNSSEYDDQCESFCRAVVGTPDLRQQVEPLVAYLITRARAHVRQQAAINQYVENGIPPEGLDDE